MLDQSWWSHVAAVYRAIARAFLSRALWLRGFIDQAKREAEVSIAEVPAADYPIVFCRALCFGACRIMSTTGDFAAAEKAIARLIEAATEINAPFWQTVGQFFSGELMVERQQFASRVSVLHDAFDTCRRTGWHIWCPEFKGALATGLSGLGQLDEALAAVNDGLDDVVQGEHGQDLFFAELLRIKGEILLRHEAVTAAEHSFTEALNVARKQEALLWELRAALSFARLRVAQDRRGEARQMLVPVYGRFTEGFDTVDLLAAKRLLDG
jgi:predicted ATPase